MTGLPYSVVSADKLPTVQDCESASVTLPPLIYYARFTALSYPPAFADFYFMLHLKNKLHRESTRRAVHACRPGSWLEEADL